MMPDGLTFDAATHTYRIDGRPVPSVTQILGDVLPGWQAGEWYLQRGTVVHACAAMIARGEEFDCDPQIAGQVEACRAWFRDVRPHPVAVEHPVCSRRLGYAGTLDMVAIIGKTPMIVDWKASEGPAAKYQLAAYALAYAECGYGSVRWGVAVELHEDGPSCPSERYDLRALTADWQAIRRTYDIRREAKIRTEQEA